MSHCNVICISVQVFPCVPDTCGHIVHIIAGPFLKAGISRSHEFSKSDCLYTDNWLQHVTSLHSGKRNQSIRKAKQAKKNYKGCLKRSAFQTSFR